MTLYYIIINYLNYCADKLMPAGHQMPNFRLLKEQYCYSMQTCIYYSTWFAVEAISTVHTHMYVIVLLLLRLL